MDVRAFTLAAGIPLTINHPGRMLILVDSAAPVDITLLGPGGQVLREQGRQVEAGYTSFPADWLDRDDRFMGLRIESTTGQTVKIGISDRAAGYNPRTTVQVEKPNAIETAADVTVSTVVVQIVASNANRKSVVIQNVHATGIMRLGESPGVAAARGIRLQAGQSVVFESTAAIFGIREGATDATAAVLEETRT